MPFWAVTVCGRPLLLGGRLLCDDCQKSYDAWLDPRQLSIEARLDYIGRDTPKGRSERMTENADKWYRTVNFQLDLITRICQEKHQITEPTQDYLFDLETV